MKIPAYRLIHASVPFSSPSPLIFHSTKPALTNGARASAKLPLILPSTQCFVLSTTLFFPALPTPPTLPLLLTLAGPVFDPLPFSKVALFSNPCALATSAAPSSAAPSRTLFFHAGRKSELFLTIPAAPRFPLRARSASALALSSRTSFAHASPFRPIHPSPHTSCPGTSRSMSKARCGIFSL